MRYKLEVLMKSCEENHPVKLSAFGNHQISLYRSPLENSNNVVISPSQRSSKAVPKEALCRIESEQNPKRDRNQPC